MIFDCGSPQNDVDVLLVACDVRARTALDIAKATSSTLRFADVRRRLDAADVARAAVAAWRSLKLGDLEANDRAPVLSESEVSPTLKAC
jgi:hypothetical protein